MYLCILPVALMSVPLLQVIRAVSFPFDLQLPALRGQTVVKQHQLVHKILKEEMAEWHGLNLTTKAP
jgi:hypothetical protein